MRISRHKEVVPGDLRTVVGRLRDWAVAQAERALMEEEVPQGPFPSAKAFSPSPSRSFNYVFHLWPK